jgi:hypothetical protein
MNNPWIHLAENLIPNSQLLHCSRPEILHNDIALLHQFQKDIASSLMLEIQTYRPLIPVDSSEIIRYWSCIGFPGVAFGAGFPVPRIIAAVGIFDFDYGGTIVGQDLSAEGGGEDAGEVEDFDAFEGAVG